MKTGAIIIAVASFAGLIGPSIAFEGIRGIRIQGLLTNVSCDVREEDNQALCARKCDDEFISSKMRYSVDPVQVAADKKACDEKCGCHQNSR